VSLFDRLTWAFIGHLVKTDPDLALQIMGAPDPERLARLQQMLTGHRPVSGPYGVRDPRNHPEDRQ
jgi:hypothetical protein